MVSKNGAETRKQRIAEISVMLEGAKERPLKLILALIARKHGLTSPKAFEYLEVLEATGRIKIDRDKGTLSWVEDYVEDNNASIG